MKHYVTEADGGAVKVGNNGTFTANFPNGYGDGDVDVFVLEDGERVPDGAQFVGVIEGEQMNVYAHDGKECNEIVITLRGRYGVYTLNGDHNGAVAFEPWQR